MKTHQAHIHAQRMADLEVLGILPAHFREARKQTGERAFAALVGYCLRANRRDYYEADSILRAVSQAARVRKQLAERAPLPALPTFSPLHGFAHHDSLHTLASRRRYFALPSATAAQAAALRALSAIKPGTVTVELEFAGDDTFAALPRTAFPSSSALSWATDGSVRGDHLGRWQEVRVTCRLSHLAPLYDVCSWLSANGANVNKSCGLHVHLDMRGKTNGQYRTAFRRLVDALPWLLRTVPASRRNGDFCRTNTDYTRAGAGRYYAINPTSFAKWQTLEIRLAAGSIDADKIALWVQLVSFLASYRKSIKTLGELLLSPCTDAVKYWVVMRHSKFNSTIGTLPEASETN